jgi:NADH-quinone oxidoreductase subunit L
MMLVVFADDLFVLLVGLGGDGCLLLLPDRPPLGAAGRARQRGQGFVVTRLGDVGFLFGIFTLSVAAGGSRITTS